MLLNESPGSIMNVNQECKVGKTHYMYTDVEKIFTRRYQSVDEGHANIRKKGQQV